MHFVNKLLLYIAPSPWEALIYTDNSISPYLMSRFPAHDKTRYRVQMWNLGILRPLNNINTHFFDSFNLGHDPCTGRYHWHKTRADSI